MTMNLKIKIAALALLIAVASVQVISNDQGEEQTRIHQMMPE